MRKLKNYKYLIFKHLLIFGILSIQNLTDVLYSQNIVQNTSKPNIIILFTDDQGMGDVSCYGNEKIQTPNLDKMANEGARFTNFYVAAASCTPSRASLLTGCYPQRVGLPSVIDDLSKKGLSTSEFTIAAYLKQNGYATGMFGKWHLGHQPEFMPNRHGFQEFVGIPYSADMWPFHPKPGHDYPPLPMYENENIIDYNFNINEMTTLFTERAVNFIKKNKEKPFFIYLPYAQPHVPLGVSSKFRGKSNNGLYGDAVMEIDWSVAQILEALDKNGLTKNTLVLFTSDNGPWLSYGNHAGTTNGLREGKATTFDGGFKVPFIASMPGIIPEGTVVNNVVSALDILPTVLNITETNMPRMNPIDGRNTWPLFIGDSEIEEQPFFFVNGNEVQAVRVGKWKLHNPHKYRIVISKGKDGLPGNQDNSGGEIELALFNLDEDPNETNNLARKTPNVVKRLQQLIIDFEQDLKNNSRPVGVVQDKKF